jgi:alpha 1,3-mannosyltransferase
MRGLDSLDSMTGYLSPRLEKFDPEYLTHYVSSPSRCLKVVRGLAFTGCAVFCVLLYTSVATHSDWNYVPSSLTTNTTTGVTTTKITTSTTPYKTTSQSKEQGKGSLWGQKKPQYYTIHTNEPYDIDTALRTVLNLCPDEVYYNVLTLPITTGGEAKLHETGVRVRMFKKYFDAWEALHVVTDSLSDTAFVRDDILRHIRDSKDVSPFTSGSRIEAMRQYETYRSFLSNMSSTLFPWTNPYFSDHMTLHGHMYNAGRGIVISGSNSQASYIKTAISSFRAMGCTLPVEIMYLGDSDLSEDTRMELETIPDVVTRDVKKMVNDQGWELEGWAGKAFAAFLSSFREVILLDADVLFFNDPALMFEEPGYVETGALFFTDRTVFAQDKRTFLRKIMPKPVSNKLKESRWWLGETGENQESGVVVVDKWRHFLSIFLTARLNGPDRSDTDAGQGTYSFWWGDKETWWIGFELAGDTDYHFHQGGTGNMGTVTNTEPIEKKEDKEEDKQEEKKENQDDTSKEDTTADENPHTTDTDDFEHNLAKLEENQPDKTAEPTVTSVAADLENNLKQLQSDQAVHTEEPTVARLAGEVKPDTETGSNVEFLAPAPDADDVMKAIKAAEAARAARLPTEEGHYLPVLENVQPADESGAAESATATEGSPAATEEPESDRARSRRHLTKRDSWFDIAMETKRTNLTGPGMLDLPDQNIILCSPQLLHLSRDGRPLWFNGWIQDNKHDASSDVSVFEFFMSEKRKDNEWAEWIIGADNMCCLKGDDLHMMNDKELKALELIVDIAKENGSLKEVLDKERKANKNIAD